WLHARFGITEATIGYFYVYYGVLSFVMRSAFLGPVVDRIGETCALRLGTILLAAGMLLYPLVPSLVVLVLIIPFVPVGTALMFPAVTSLLSHRVDPAELGTMMGVGQTFAGIARIVAPIVGTMVFQWVGISAPFFLAGFIVMLVSWATFRHVRVIPAEAETVI
ncbi:MAG: MFS transporter, partial [Gemmatimonadales bacterium]